MSKLINAIENLTMSIDGLETSIAKEINKLTQEVIKLNERIEDASTCAGGGKA
jgi:flagellar hook-associated protein FlgK